MAEIQKDIFQEIMVAPFRYACFTRFIDYCEENYYSVHNSFQILVGISGTLFTEIEGQKRIIKSTPGSVFVLGPGIRHRWYSEAGKTCENFMFFCDGYTDNSSGPGQVFNSKNSNISWLFNLNNDDHTYFTNTFRKLTNNHNPFNASIMHGLLNAFCGLICQEATRRELLNNPRKTHPALARAIDIINRDFRQKISLEYLSENSGISQSRLSELFKTTYGMSPIQYLNDLKIKKAQQLIKYSDMNITQIAEFLGFSSIHYFSRFFKKHTNMQASSLNIHKS